MSEANHREKRTLGTLLNFFGFRLVPLRSNDIRPERFSFPAQTPPNPKVNMRMKTVMPSTTPPPTTMPPPTTTTPAPTTPPPPPPPPSMAPSMPPMDMSRILNEMILAGATGSPAPAMGAQTSQFMELSTTERAFSEQFERTGQFTEEDLARLRASFSNEQQSQQLVEQSSQPSFDQSSQQSFEFRSTPETRDSGEFEFVRSNDQTNSYFGQQTFEVPQGYYSHSRQYAAPEPTQKYYDSEASSSNSASSDNSQFYTYINYP